MEHPAIIACPRTLAVIRLRVQPFSRGQTTPSGGNAQLLGADSRTELTLRLAASCTVDGVVVSIAPMISEQTARQAANKVRNIKVSNFMAMSPIVCVSLQT
jgi:hypothetical protein